MTETILIIGSGIAGLTSAYFAIKNGFKVKVYERNENLGGYCTSWKRKNYTINSGIHAIVGIKEKEQYNDLWKELGILDNMTFIAHDLFQNFEIYDEIKDCYETIEINSDLMKLKEYLVRYSPEDKKIIDEIISAALKLSKANIILENEPELNNFMKKINGILNMIPYLPILAKWKNITVKTVSGKFKNPFLRQAFLKIWDPNFSFLFVLFLLAFAYKKNLGFPIGGGTRIIDIISGKLKNLGCEFYTKTDVEQVIIENGRAVGIVLKNGEKVSGDYIISAADGMYTMNTLLNGKYTSPQHKVFYENPVQALSAIETNLCIKGGGKEFNPSIFGTYIIFEKPLKLTNESIDYSMMYINNFDKTYNQNGFIITFTMNSNYDYWIKMNTEAYNSEKEKVKTFVLDYLKKNHPSMMNDIEYIDISTPLTFHKYSNSYKGSLQGWLATSEKWNKYIPKSFKDLKCFYMCGQWTESLGGLPIAGQTGKNVIKLLCKEKKKQFKT